MSPCHAKGCISLVITSIVCFLSFRGKDSALTTVIIGFIIVVMFTLSAGLLCFGHFEYTNQLYLWVWAGLFISLYIFGSTLKEVYRLKGSQSMSTFLEPTILWWRQRPGKTLAVLVLLLVVLAVAIPVGVLVPTSSLEIPSPSPTVSPLPTITCNWVDIVVVFDEYPLETSWQIQKIVNSGDNIVLETFNGTSDEANKVRNESMCLEGEQTYQFTIYDDYEDGILAPGHYNVTSNGSLIAQGGKFGLEEVTTFSIPFVPGSSMTNIIPTPSPSPTVSSQPTITCYWVDIMVVFDEWIWDTSWEIEQIVSFGHNIPILKTTTVGEGKKLYIDAMCLEGEQTYRFQIYDFFGHGISSPGYYNVTSNGNLIVEGNDFGKGQITTFSIPFIPPFVLDGL